MVGISCYCTARSMTPQTSCLAGFAEALAGEGRFLAIFKTFIICAIH